MNKQELVRYVQSIHPHTSLIQIETILDSFLHVIIGEVERGSEVKLIPLGTFTKTKRKSRKGRNPKTGEAMVIPEMWMPKLRAGQNFKNYLNGKGNTLK